MTLQEYASRNREHAQQQAAIEALTAFNDEVVEAIRSWTVTVYEYNPDRRYAHLPCLSERFVLQEHQENDAHSGTVFGHGGEFATLVFTYDGNQDDGWYSGDARGFGYG